MKKIFLFLFLFYCGVISGQSLNRKYSADVYLGASKEDLIDIVIQKVYDYYIYDENGVIKKMQKEKKIKLSKTEDREEFLAQMADDIEKILFQTNTWGWEETAAIRNNYFISITELLCNEIWFPTVGKPNTGFNGKGNLTLWFNKNILSAININMETIKDNSIDNRHPYTDFILNEISKIITTELGNYTHERRIGSWNMCSADKTEPVYYEKFNLNDGKITGYIEAEFGAYIYRIDKNNCRYRGNQLTAVSMYFYYK